MAKSNFFKRLLTGSDANTPQKGLSSPKQNDICSLLDEKYGISITQLALTVDELSEQGYRKISGDEFARVNQVFQFIPQIVANQAGQRAAAAAFQAATEGTFRVSLPANMHLCRSLLSPDAYRAVGLSNATNQIAGNAE